MAQQARVLCKIFENYGRTIRHVDGDNLAESYTGGRTLQTISSKIWDSPFCNATSREWVRDPLSIPQEYHLAAAMNLWKELVMEVQTFNVLAGAQGVAGLVPKVPDEVEAPKASNLFFRD